LIKKYN